MKTPYGTAQQPVDYLESRATNASSAELQQMLLDGAIRFARKAESIWDDESRSAEVQQLITRIMDIMESLTMGVAESKDPVAEQLEEQYAFLFREFAVVSLERDRARFDKAVKLLAFERETWHMGYERARGGNAEPATGKRADEPAPAPPRRHAAPLDLPAETGGFSVEA